MNIQDIWSNALHLVGQAWWVEITTEQPNCTYYFGPFTTAVEADAAKAGYVEDLESESAIGIQVAIKRCKPERVTIDREPLQENDYLSIVKSPLSGQFG